MHFCDVRSCFVFEFAILIFTVSSLEVVSYSGGLSHSPKYNSGGNQPL